LSEASPISPLIALEAARIEAGGETSEPFDTHGGSRAVALVGNFRPLFRLLARDARLVSGRAEILGAPCGAAVAERVVGLALSDPPLPEDWTVERYLTESARLVGLDQKHARDEVDAALTSFGLSSFARHRLAQTARPLRRAVLLAHATLAAPPVLCAEAPLADLDPFGQAEVAAVLERAAVGRRLVVSFRGPRTNGAERAFARRADWVVVEENGRVSAEGPPERVLANGSRYVAVVTRASAAFIVALSELGIFVRRDAVTRLSMPPDATTGAEPVELVFELPHGTTANDVAVAARRAGAPLVELGQL
jgi:ABC-type Na+ transport system ATPase subunit NatA